MCGKREKGVVVSVLVWLFEVKAAVRNCSTGINTYIWVRGRSVQFRIKWMSLKEDSVHLAYPKLSIMKIHPEPALKSDHKPVRSLWLYDNRD